VNGKKGRDLPLLLRRHLFNIFKRICASRSPLWPLLFGIVYTLVAYRGAWLTIGGDNLIPFHANEYLLRLMSPSNPWAGFGSPLPPIFSLPPLPDTGLFFLFSFANIYTANVLYVFVLSTLSIFSVCYLATAVFCSSAHRSVIGIVSACAYVFNPWVLADTYKTMIFMELSLAQTGFILFLAFAVKYFQTRQTRYTFYSGLASFLMLSYPGLSGYRLAFFAFLGYCFIAIYSASRVRTQLRKASSDIFKGMLIIATISFVINSYWIIPFVQNSNYFSSFASGFQPRTAFNKFSTIENTLRLMNSWSFYSGYVPYAESFTKNPMLIVLTFAWPIFAFLSLLSRDIVKNRKILAIYLATIFTILLALGSEYPFGEIYTAFINAHVGSYYFLRPFYKTGAISSLILTLEYALLIGLFSSLVHSWLKRKCKGFRPLRREIAAAFGAVLIVTILASSSWPILTGDIMRNWYNPDQYGVRIPNSYWDANEYLEEKCDMNHRTLLLPPTQVYVGTSWGYQGTSQFYSLMFNVPFVTGNEVPYGLTSNTSLVKQVYSFYYTVSGATNSVDVINQTRKIIAWQNDEVISTSKFLQIDFNSTFQPGRWHQIELRSLSADTWSGLTHMVVQFTGELSLDHLQIGVEDTNGYVGWWSASKQIYQLNNVTFIPTQAETVVTQNSGTLSLLLDLEKPDRSTYSIANVSSIWVEYFVANSSDNASLLIDRMQAVKIQPDTLYYAKLLADVNVKYLMVDLAIKDGAKDNPQLWLDMLSNSNYFKVIWQEGSLYIFENVISP
jgi:hypothetical protein